MVYHELQTLFFFLLYSNVWKGDCSKCFGVDDASTCVDNPVCNHTYNAILLELFPYSDIQFECRIQKYCGPCFKLKFNLSRLWLGVEDVNKELTKQVDIIYPVLKRNKYEMYHSKFMFLPVSKHAAFTYVTLIKMSSFQIAIKSCLDLYPLFIICLMMSILFGFIVWIFETHRSKEDYPRCFPIGWLKGIWWSMATMISTGPESTPKSFMGRIFALIWLTVAVIMVSLISSIIIAAMVKPIPTPSMSGERVGTLRFNKYTELEILRHNGRVKTIPGSDMYDELSNLLVALRRKELDGVLVDKFSLRSFLYYDMAQNIKQNSLKHFDFPYVLTEIKSDGSMSYGALIAEDKKNLEYFKSVFAQETMEAELDQLRFFERVSFIEKNMREKVNRETGSLGFTIQEPYIRDGMLWSAIMVGITLVIGTIYEIVRRKILCHRIDEGR